MSDKALAVRQEATAAIDVFGVADAFVKSGYFPDVKSQAQAVVKILAGQEAGFGPMASIMGIYIVEGKPTFGSNLLAAAVKRSGRYDYRIVTATDKACELEFFEAGKAVGKSGFTIEEAQRAKLAGKYNWQGYPSDMLFARALSRGVRRFCPDAMNGVIAYSKYDLPDQEASEEPERPQITVVPPAPEPVQPAQKPATAKIDAYLKRIGELNVELQKHGLKPMVASNTMSEQELRDIGMAARTALDEHLAGEEDQGDLFQQEN